MQLCRHRGTAATYPVYSVITMANWTQAFLSSVKCFKNTKAIPDNEALASVVRLLRGDAAVWWQRVGQKAKTWREFEVRIRNDFAPRISAYLLYSELAVKQAARQSLEDFIARKRVLFAMLPPPNPLEHIQLDMIYGLLSDNVQENVPRTSVSNFDGLLQAASQ